MKLYQCNKAVRAARIQEIVHNSKGGFTLYLEDGGTYKISNDFLHKHSPKSGEYLIIYSDNYVSVISRKTFDETYTLTEMLSDEITAAAV